MLLLLPHHAAGAPHQEAHAAEAAIMFSSFDHQQQLSALDALVSRGARASPHAALRTPAVNETRAAPDPIPASSPKRYGDPRAGRRAAGRAPLGAPGG